METISTPVRERRDCFDENAPYPEAVPSELARLHPKCVVLFQRLAKCLDHLLADIACDAHFEAYAECYYRLEDMLGSEAYLTAVRARHRSAALEAMKMHIRTKVANDETPTVSGPWFLACFEE